MSDLNCYAATGRLGADPELRYASSGKAIYYGLTPLWFEMPEHKTLHDCASAISAQASRLLHKVWVNKVVGRVWLVADNASARRHKRAKSLGMKA